LSRRLCHSAAVGMHETGGARHHAPPWPGAVHMCTQSTEPCVQEKPVRKLGFREKEEYGQLEGKIEAACTQKEDLEARIAETAQLGDFQKVAELTEDLGKLTERIDAMTDRWLELAERAEIAGTV
jgi:ABC transporter C-terminal domain